MNKDKVLDLAKLSRIKLDPSEAESLSNEFDAILNYVGEVKSISAQSSELSSDSFHIKNVMREDGEGHESGLWTEKILSQAPGRKDNFVKVKKIL